MKKILILFFLCCYFHSHAQTPDWVWGRNAVSTSLGEGWCLAADPSDNVFITGEFLGSITFGSITLTAQNATFLVKYDGNGNVKWAKSNMGGTAFGYAVTTDGIGNSFTTGQFIGSSGFGSHIISSFGSQDVFLIKYDPAGNVNWARNAGGTSADAGHGVATDASGNIYVTGTFSAPSFSIGSLTLTPGGTTCSFLAKYDSSGNVVWARNPGGTATGIGYGVATDAMGNVYETGTFGTGTITFGSYTFTSAGANDIFIVKYDSSGNVLWAKSAGGVSADAAYSLATDAPGNVYMTGYFASASITFGSTTFVNSGGNDGYLVKYDVAGNVLWAQNIKGTSNEIGYSVATDKNGKIYVAGSFSSASSTFDTVTLVRPPGWIDPLFVVEFESSGHALFAKALPSGGDDNNGVAVGPTGCVYVGGDFEQTIIVVANDTLYSATGTENVFVVKLCNSGLAANFASSDTMFCTETGKCINFFDHSTGSPTSWQWSFSGAAPNSSNLQNPDSICYSTPGTYPVMLIVGNATGYDTLTVASMIIVGNALSAPVITVVGGDTLYSSHGATYQWYLNGSPIAGATDSFYVALLGGLYSVLITDGAGCNAQSVGVVITGVETSDGVGVEIFPNPVSKTLGVMGLVFGVGARFEIFDVLGNEVYCPQLQTPNPKLQTAIDVSSLRNGIYLLKVRIDRLGTINKKFVVVHK